jgi:hypothetical protein
MDHYRSRSGKSALRCLGNKGKKEKKEPENRKRNTKKENLRYLPPLPLLRRLPPDRIREFPPGKIPKKNLAKCPPLV